MLFSVYVRKCNFRAQLIRYVKWNMSKQIHTEREISNQKRRQKAKGKSYKTYKTGLQYNVHIPSATIIT